MFNVCELDLWKPSPLFSSPAGAYYYCYCYCYYYSYSYFYYYCYYYYCYCYCYCYYCYYYFYCCVGQRLGPCVDMWMCGFFFN